jgi:hypothetical protein
VLFWSPSFGVMLIWFVVGDWVLSSFWGMMSLSCWCAYIEFYWQAVLVEAVLNGMRMMMMVLALGRALWVGSQAGRQTDTDVHTQLQQCMGVVGLSACAPCTLFT